MARFFSVVRAAGLCMLAAQAQSNLDAPKLSVSRPTSSALRLEWPASAAGYLLERTPGLSPGRIWLPVLEPPQRVGANLVVTLPPTEPQGFFRLRQSALTVVAETSPADGAEAVAVTRETVLRFSRPLAANTVLSTDRLSARSAGRRLLSRVELSGDRRTATLFYLEPLPGSTRIEVELDGTGLRDGGGTELDADGDGVPGGKARLSFTTLSTTPVPGTAVFGRVFASELVPGPDTGTGAVNRPLQGVTITVDGLEQTLRTTTDAQGNFRLEPVPSGPFFVHIDGRTAVGSQWPNGVYFPVVGKQWDGLPGRATPAAGTGQVFLPRIVAGTLQTVSLTEETIVTFPPSVVAENPALAGVRLQVPPNALYADNGTRGGRVGLAPVPPDRLPGPLPPGLEFPLVITVQTDGPQNFDQPIPVRFPNLPDPVTGQKLSPGAKSALWSFNHDTGRWELVGSMTVTTDGAYVDSDPGVGLRQPGWHGTRPGTSGKGGKTLGPEEDCPNPTRCMPKPGRDPNQFFNGCGPDGFDYAIPDNPLLLLGERPCLGGHPSFYDACKNHDIHYGTCGFPQADADNQFLQDMQQACECYRDGGDLVTYVKCLALAQTYYTAVASTSFAYDAGQKEACDCECDTPARSTSAARPHAGLNAEEPLSLGVHYYSIFDLDAQQVVQRGTTATDGVAFPEDVILAPNRNYSLALVHAATLYEGGVAFRTPASGERFEIPPIRLGPPISLDLDRDGLGAIGEFVLGTDAFKPDSDGDGVSDGAEVQQGTDPLDGLPAATGVIASTPTLGPALDVAAFNNLVVIAEGESGVGIYNVFSGMTPVLVAQVDTPGTATAVALSGALVAVADGAAGLAILDVTTPASARLRHQIDLGSLPLTVATAGPFAYVGLFSGDVMAVDMVSGAVLGRVSTGRGLQDLALEREFLFVLNQGGLSTISLRDGEFSALNSLAAPGVGEPSGRRFRLFAGDGLAYGTDLFGYRTFDLKDVFAPKLVVHARTAQAGWKQMIANGSGLGLAVVGPNSPDDVSHDLSLYDLRQATNNNVFLTTFPTPGSAAAVAIYNALAYVADGTAGLQVINYLPYDSSNRAPSIRLETSNGPNVAGAGQLLRISAAVSDDVQVRNVEFHVDGQLVATDGNFPFEYRFIAPLASVTRSNVVIRARATDTGGNATWSETLTLALVPDGTPPRPTLFSPAHRSVNRDDAVVQVSAVFNEPVDPATLDAQSFQLLSAGPDRKVGTADDSPVSSGQLSYRPDLRAVVLTLPGALPAGVYEAAVRAPLAGLTGLVLSEERRWTFEVRAPVRWARDGDGFWDLPANWSGGVVPQAEDFVILDRPSGQYTITFRSGDLSLTQLDCAESLAVVGGTLNFARASSIEHELIFSGGNLGGTGDLIVNGTIRWLGGNWQGSARTVARGGLELIGPGNKVLDARTLENERVTVWRDGGSLVGVFGATFNNQPGAVFTAENDAAFGYICCLGNGLTFNNRGTFRKTGSNGITRIESTTFNNVGLVEVETGTLRIGGNSSGSSLGEFRLRERATLEFANSDYTLAPGASVVGGGSLLHTSGTLTLTGDVAIPQLQFDGGVITGPGRLQLQSAHWTGGNFRGPGVVAVVTGGTLTWSGNSGRTIDGRTIDNAGTVLWLDTGGVANINGAVFNNLAGGIFEAGGDANFGYICCVGAGPTFNNHGVVRKAGGTQATAFQSTVFNNFGTVEVNSGRLEFHGSGGVNQGTVSVAEGKRFDLRSGNYTLEGTRFEGAGWAASSAQVQLVGAVSAENFELTTGRLEGAGSLTVNRAMEWLAGDMRGPGLTEIPSGAIANLRGNDGKTLDGRVLRNAGTLTWSGKGGIAAYNGAVVDNLAGGLFEAQSDAGFGYICCVGAGPTIRNHGLVRKTLGTQATTFNGTAFHNDGTLEVVTGWMEFNGGGGTNRGAVHLAAGTRLDLNGGEPQLDGAKITGEGWLRSKAELQVTGASAAENYELLEGRLRGSGNFTLTRQLVWTAGEMVGPGSTEIAAGASAWLRSNNGKALNGRRLRNAGALTWTDAGGIAGINGAGIENLASGVFELQTDAGFGYVNFVGAIPFFDNAGTLRKTVTTGTSQFYNVGFTNRGVIELKRGVLKLTREYVQTSDGTLVIELNGAAAGAGYGRLTTDGLAMLAGSFVVSLGDNYTPLVGDAFQVLTSTTRTGQFDRLTGLNLSNTQHLEADLSNQGLTLRTVSGP